MSHLAKLLNESEPALDKTIEKLESLSGYNSEDVRLTVDIERQASSKIASLGLDPADTTGEELYQALQEKLKNDSRRLAGAINIEPETNASEMAEKLVALAGHTEVPKVLSIKAPTIKSLFRAHPPKKLMKQLGYRSLESMLKRQNVRVLLATAPAVESASWLRGVSKNLSKLAVNDYEFCQIELIAMSAPAGAQQADRAVTYGPLTATVEVWPNPALKAKPALFNIVLILQAIEILEVESFYLQSHQLKADFGKLADSLFTDSDPLALPGELAKFNWHNLWQAHRQKNPIFDKLANLHPVFNWWRGSEHLLHGAGDVVSLSLADNLTCLGNRLAYGERATASAIHDLKSNLLKRYSIYPGVQGHLATALALEPVPSEDDLAGQLTFDEAGSA